MDPNPDTTPASDSRGRRFAMLFLRHGLAALLAILGVAGLIAGHGHTATAGAGVVLLGVAVMVWMLNWLLRLGLSSGDDRVRDEEARDYFSAHGHWPGEG
jgi:hypothetical protein